jgi:hypothetical protein
MFCARSAALRPSSQNRGCREQLRADLHPATRKPRVSGTPGLRRKEMFFNASRRFLLTAGVSFAYSSYWQDRERHRRVTRKGMHPADLRAIVGSTVTAGFWKLLGTTESGIGGGTRKGLQPLWTVAYRLGPSFRGL